MGLLSTSPSPNQSIRIIHSTSRWLRGRGEEVFWDNFKDSAEWDENEERKAQFVSYIPGRWDSSRYSLPMEIRIHLGINWLRTGNVEEAMVLSYLYQSNRRDNLNFWKEKM
jgi:hypothetical protein